MSDRDCELKLLRPGQDEPRLVFCDDPGALTLADSCKTWPGIGEIRFRRNLRQLQNSDRARQPATARARACQRATSRDVTGARRCGRTRPPMLGASTSSFAHRPAGTGNTELADRLEEALARVDELRHDLGALAAQAGTVRGGGLIELDIGRTLAGLAVTRRHLERAHRHARLEP